MHVASCQLIHSEWKHDRNRFLMTASARKLKFCVETPKDLCGTIMHTWWPRFRFICFVTLNTPCALFAPERCRFYHRYFWLAVTTVIRNTSTLGTMVPFITQTIMLLNPPKKKPRLITFQQPGCDWNRIRSLIVQLQQRKNGRRWFIQRSLVTIGTNGDVLIYKITVRLLMLGVVIIQN